MNFQESIQTCFRKYADFTGRASRPEFWWFVLFLFVAGIVAATIHQALYWVFWLATLLPAIAVTARRLHDTNRSGWWQLISFVPLIGTIVLIVFLVQPAQTASNYEATA